MRSTNFLRRYKLHHMLFWALVFVLWFYLRYQDYATKGIAAMVTFVKVTDLALVVYAVNYLMIPRLLYRRRYLSFICLFALVIAVSGFVKMIIVGEITGSSALASPFANLKSRFYENVVSDFFLVTSGAAFKLIFDYIDMQQKVANLAREKAEAELSFLKSQINPHFLFNSINSVYFLIDKENAEARAALHKFSEMLRYQLYEMQGTRVPIEKELTYLKDYVDLQRLRRDENYSVEVNFGPGIKNFSIEPLLLIPFVENAFKHISHKPGQRNFVKLDISRSNGHFNFSVENSKEDARNGETQGGIGLHNVKRRLEILYPGRHELTIDNRNDVYKVDLMITLEAAS